MRTRGPKIANEQVESFDLVFRKKVRAMTELEIDFSKRPLQKNLNSEISRISIENARDLFINANDEELMSRAQDIKTKFHDPYKPTYLIMAIVNYTNVCVAACSYCSFYKLPHEAGTYLLNFDQIAAKIDQAMELGATMVGFNGGFHPKLKILDYAEIFSRVRARYGNTLEFYGMTVAEFMFSAKLSKLSYVDAANKLRENGSTWVTGGGAEILEDTFRRKLSPGKFTVADYFSAQQAIIDSGLNSTATMVIGFGETLDQRLSHLESLRQFQDRQTRPMPSFLCWTYKPYFNSLGGNEISTSEYLRWMAVCRIYLDNFKHIRTSVLTKNEEALKALDFGADDFDLPTEDEVTQKAGATVSLEFDAILNRARELGYSPVHRRPF